MKLTNIFFYFALIASTSYGSSAVAEIGIRFSNHIIKLPNRYVVTEPDYSVSAFITLKSPDYITNPFGEIGSFYIGDYEALLEKQRLDYLIVPYTKTTIGRYQVYLEVINLKSRSMLGSQSIHKALVHDGQRYVFISDVSLDVVVNMVSSLVESAAEGSVSHNAESLVDRLQVIRGELNELAKSSEEEEQK